MPQLRERGEFRTTLRTDLTTGVNVDLLPDTFGVDIYPWLTATSEVSIVSTSPLDNGSGQGAQTVELNMLTATFDSQTISLDLSGVSPVAVPGGPWYRCNGLRVTQAGINGVAAGVLSLTADTGGELMAAVNVGGTRFQGCIYTVPSDERINWVGMEITISDPQNANNDVLIGSLRSRRNGETAWSIEVATQLLNITVSTATFPLAHMIWAPGTDLRLNALSSSTSTDAFGRLAFHRQQGSGPL